MKYIYIYDITNGKIMGKTTANANYVKMQQNLKVETDIIYSDIDLSKFIYNFQVNLVTKELELKPV